MKDTDHFEIIIVSIARPKFMEMEGCLDLVDWNDGMPGMVEWNGLECGSNGVLGACTHGRYTPSSMYHQLLGYCQGGDMGLGDRSMRIMWYYFTI